VTLVVVAAAVVLVADDEHVDKNDNDDDEDDDAWRVLSVYVHMQKAWHFVTYSKYQGTTTSSCASRAQSSQLCPSLRYPYRGGRQPPRPSARSG
jgi:hypothetical protein